jgi:hypothetical protein
MMNRWFVRAFAWMWAPPGKQLQSDFGERRAMIGDENVKVYLFVATLGYSRRLYVRPFRRAPGELVCWCGGRLPSLRKCCSTMIAGWSLVTTG